MYHVTSASRIMCRHMACHAMLPFIDDMHHINRSTTNWHGILKWKILKSVCPKLSKNQNLSFMLKVSKF